MTSFFSVRARCFYTDGFPRLVRLKTGLRHGRKCPRCRRHQDRPVGEVAVVLAAARATHWPDVLDAGTAPLFIVTQRGLHDWYRDGLGPFPADRVKILDPLPKKLRGTPPPDYFWLHGEDMRGARVDFAASGFGGVRFCPICRRRSEDVRATYQRQHAKPWSYVFVEGSWNGAHLFTTDLSPSLFFCTEAILACARKYRYTNCCFTRVEAGDAAGHHGPESQRPECTMATY